MRKSLAFAALLTTLLGTVVWGADVKISNLPLGSASTTGGADSFPYVQASTNVTKRLTVWDLSNVPTIVSTYAPKANPTFTGTVTGPTFVGALTGNASTATALASNPTDCSANQFANAIAANGNLTCAQPTVADLGVLTASRALETSAGGVITVSSYAPATNANTASSLVARDASGNFSAGTVSAALTGTASGNTTYTANNHGVVLSGSGNTMTVLAPNASTSKVLTSGGSSADPSWQDPASAPTSSNQISNVGISASISSSTLVIALKQSDGSTDCSSGTSACLIGYRNSTATTGGYSQASVTSSMSITLGATDSLGNQSGGGAVVHVYFVQDTSSEICASASVLDEGALYSATALTGSAEISPAVLYCTSAHTSRPIHRIGEVIASWGNPNWSSITDVKLIPYRPLTPFFGTITYAGTASCDWSTTSSSLANFSADTDCPTPTLTGFAKAPGTKIPGIVFDSIPKGRYRITAVGAQFYSTHSGARNASFSFNDGSVGTATNNLYFSISGDYSVPTLVGEITYPTDQGSTTIQLQGRTSAGTLHIENSQSSFEAFTIHVDRLGDY